MEQKEMIRIRNLNKSYGSLHVLKDIDMKVLDSDVVCLIGPSGSGKSTLLRCLNYLEKKDSGQILIEGTEIQPGTHDINKIREKVGMVFQHFYLFPHMTVLENVIEAPTHVKKVPKAEQSRKQEHCLPKSAYQIKRMSIQASSQVGRNSVWP